jgi:hypothetical protein
MPQTLLLRQIIWVVFLAFSLITPCTAQNSSQQIAAEIARLKHVLVVLPESDDAAAFRPVLEQAEQDVHANRPLAALFRLQRSAAQLDAMQYRATHKEIETRGIEAFGGDWQQLGSELAAREKQLAALPRARSNAVAHAFAEASLTKVKPLYQAAKLYAREDTIASGLYYLGQSLGLLDFALYCRRLPLTSTRPVLALRSFAPELAELEKDVLTAYSKADVTAQQGLYNQLHATLKTAQDLNRERRYAGALFQYLEAQRVLNLLKPSAAAPAITDLQNKSAAFQTQLAARKRDNSLALLYWEVAQSALASGSPDNLPMAAIILNEVLPRYFKLIPE